MMHLNMNIKVQQRNQRYNFYLYTPMRQGTQNAPKFICSFTKKEVEDGVCDLRSVLNDYENKYKKRWDDYNLFTTALLMLKIELEEMKLN